MTTFVVHAGVQQLAVSCKLSGTSSKFTREEVSCWTMCPVVSVLRTGTAVLVFVLVQHLSFFNVSNKMTRTLQAFGRSALSYRVSDFVLVQLYSYLFVLVCRF